MRFPPGGGASQPPETRASPCGANYSHARRAAPDGESGMTKRQPVPQKLCVCVLLPAAVTHGHSHHLPLLLGAESPAILTRWVGHVSSSSRGDQGKLSASRVCVGVSAPSLLCSLKVVVLGCPLACPCWVSASPQPPVVCGPSQK